MKKRSILAGLAIAAVAVLGLASCGEAAQSSTPAAASSAAATTVTVTLKLGEATVTQTVNNGDKVEVDMTKFTLPAGKVVDYWTEDGVTPFNFETPITEATTLTAVLKDSSEYNTLAASDKCIFAADGENMTIATADGFNGTKGLYAAAADDATVTTSKEYKLSKNAMYADFGGAKTSGVLTVYFELATAATNTEAFFVLDGKSAAKTDNAEVFALRDSKGALKYRFDGGADVDLAQTITANTTYKYKVVLNMSEGKISIYRDGTALVENASTNISAVRGFKFTAKNTGVTAKTIDNIAATFEEAAVSPVVAAKTAATKKIDDYLASAEYTSANDAVKKLIKDYADDKKSDISESTSVDTVSSIISIWDTNIAKEKRTVTVKAYSAANTAVAGTTDYVIAYFNGEKIDVSKASYSGYTISKIYTDEALTTELAAETAASADTTLYAKVSQATQSGASLDIAALAVGDITADTVINDTFSILANASKKVTVAESSKTAEDGFACTKMIKTNGVSSTTYRTVKITVNSACKITVYGYTGSNNNERELQLQDASGNMVASMKSSTTDGLTKMEYNATGAGVFYVVATTNSFNICGVVVA